MFERIVNGTLARTTAAGLLILASSSIGCGGGGGVGITPVGVVASFVESGTAVAANGVRSTGTASGDLVNVQIVIGGPTTSPDLYSFAFDLVLGDDTVAEYVTGSASVGTALTTSGGQSLQVLATQQGDRVAVGVTKLGGGPGNGVTGAGEAVVVELAFRLLSSGTTTLTIEGAPGADPAVLDSSGADIGSVTFDSAVATLVGI